jgi:glycosyltransferase involved in cell wall biosynthesis
LLLEAFALFNKKTSNPFTLTIYGKGSLQVSLQEQASTLGIADKVNFAGFYADVMAKIKNSAMYILSSDYEGIPNSLLEAMAIGLPVIATDCPAGGPASLIRHGENGLLVPVGDAAALATAMSELAANPDTAARMAKEAIKVREQYSVDIITKQWINLMQHFI